MQDAVGLPLVHRRTHGRQERLQISAHIDLWRFREGHARRRPCRAQRHEGRGQPKRILRPGIDPLRPDAQLRGQPFAKHVGLGVGIGPPAGVGTFPSAAPQQVLVDHRNPHQVAQIGRGAPALALLQPQFRPEMRQPRRIAHGAQERVLL